MLGQAGEAVIEPGAPYREIRDQHVADVLAHRNGSAERELIQRMLANRELVRRQVSDKLEPVQLDLLGGRQGTEFFPYLQAAGVGQAAFEASGSASRRPSGVNRTPSPTHRGDPDA